MAIVTMQDLLDLGDEARMNLPNTVGGNWIWRMTKDQLTPQVEETLLDLTTTYRRTNKKLAEKKH
jgi:4-alpha-glucanotransferase